MLLQHEKVTLQHPKTLVAADTLQCIGLWGNEMTDFFATWFPFPASFGAVTCAEKRVTCIGMNQIFPY